MKPMETIQDLIEEAKVRTVWWALCIFSVCYFLSHTSTSMWMNLPIAILIVCGLRILCNEVEFSWKVKGVRSQSYLSQFGKKQLSLNDSRLSNAPSQPKWKRKIGSPIVEAAINDFIDKILKDFVIDLWYSEITPDKEAPELMRSIILDAIGEISVRVKEINLVDLLTRDIVDLVGDHFDLFRKNQAVIGVDVMGTLSSEERDDRLKHHLMASKELHPALISPESEYKVLQKIVGGLLAVVLKPREAQCPIVRTIARELVTCLVMQPIISLASPSYINEVIEIILLAIKDGSIMEFSCKEPEGGLHDGDSSRNYSSLHNQGTDITLSKISNPSETALDHHKDQDEAMHNRSADWGQMLEAVTQRRTEVLTPENLENMWTKGRNYKKKELKKEKAKVQEAARKASGKKNAMSPQDMGKEMPTNSIGLSAGAEEKSLVRRVPGLSFDAPVIEGNEKGTLHLSFGREQVDVSEDKVDLDADGNKSRLKRSNSTSALKVQSDAKRAFVGDSDGPIIAEFYSPDFCRHSEEHRVGTHSDLMLSSEGSLVPKLKCRVMGAYFEKLGSKSFAVYSIAVTDSENRTWFVKRRYSNFERLHRHLKDIPNYTLHLPPKRIFSSSTEDAFVHQRCIQLDKYLQDLLSIANVAEQHEVWDFLSVSSKNYSFGKSSSVMRTLAVNVDDAVDDIVRQFKGVSDGLRRKVVGTSSPDEASSLMSSRHMSWNSDETNEDITSSAHANGWHSDNELNSKGFPPRVLKRGEECTDVNSEKASRLEGRSDCIGQGGLPALNVSPSPQHLEDLTGMPPEWTPPNVSVPLLSLVDKIFQLNRRGWLRRQVFWISKQILQLVMEDAIDDWLLRQIYWLRREDIIAQGIRWIQDVLWPGGIFFTRLRNGQDADNDAQESLKGLQGVSQVGASKVSKPVSFEEQLEATRRASDVKKMLFDGAPTALVSLIGAKQYKRCARDIYYFTQSTVCVKQLAYGILELLLITVFPELRDVVRDIHENTLAKK